MGDVNALANLDIPYILIGLVLILVVIVFVWKNLDWLKEKIGFELKSNREKQEDHDAILRDHDILLEAIHKIGDVQKDSEEGDRKLAKSIDTLTDKVDALALQLDKMQEKADANNRSDLKDKIATLYRKYHNEQKWTEMEKETFSDLIKSYEDAGGVNSFVHTKCLPEMYTWEIIED